MESFQDIRASRRGTPPWGQDGRPAFDLHGQLRGSRRQPSGSGDPRTEAHRHHVARSLMSTWPQQQQPAPAWRAEAVVSLFARGSTTTGHISKAKSPARNIEIGLMTFNIIPLSSLPPIRLDS